MRINLSPLAIVAIVIAVPFIVAATPFVFLVELCKEKFATVDKRSHEHAD